MSKKTTTKNIFNNESSGMFKTLLMAAILVVTGFPKVVAFAQTAVLIDGTVLTLKQPEEPFVIGDLLMIFNQDPRFGADIFGIADMHIPMAVFVEHSLGHTVDTIGHTVGEHVLFVQELITTEMIDPSQGLIVATERWQFNNSANEIRFRGVASGDPG